MTLSLITLSSSKVKTVLAIGCDTYYRVTGQIAGCNDVSTEDAREAWLEKYKVCLQQQLSREISIYDSKLQTYYAENDQDAESNIQFNDISPQEQNIPSLSFSQSQSSSYRGNADFCDQEI